MAGSVGARERGIISQGRQRRLVFRASLLAMSVLGAGNAFGQCVPNPSQAGQAITCTGTQAGGYTIATDQSPLTVSAGGSIQNSGDALTVSIPSTGNYDPRTASLTIAGSVSSSGGNGVLFTSGAPFANYPDVYGTSGTINVSAGASISGTTGITIGPNSSYPSQYSTLSVAIDNAGTITGTSGIAIAGGGNGYFYTNLGITNESSGTLGAITASFNTVINKGLIDGGAQSAISGGANYASAITNSGTIQAEGSAATLASANTGTVTNSGSITNTGAGAAVIYVGNVINQAAGSITAVGADVVTGTYFSLTNYGTISNLGVGQAISGQGVTMYNYAGGTITAGSGGTAINAANYLYLVNSGTINGDVLGGSGSSTYQTSYVDNSLGTINGNLTFGASSNILVATISNGAIQTGVTGTITAPTSGLNTIVVTTIADATLSNPVPLPANFTQLQFNPASGTTLTLGNGFSNNGTIIDNGAGMLVNAATLSGTGTIFSAGFSAGLFSNTGVVSSSNSGGPVAVSLAGYASLNNSGTISATGDAVNGGYSFANSGTITAGGTAVQEFVVNGFTNSGVITSTAGTALVLSQSCTCSTATNSGTISGALVGVQIQDGILNNSGTITSPGYGITLDFYGTVNNLVGGVITGGAVAIGTPNGTPFNTSITNAGTINGNVNLAGSGVLGYYLNANTFDAAPGGVLNGNLTLGAGDTLVADLVNSGSGAFAGISGTVTANQSNLVYNVSADATVPATAPAGFNSVAYQLFNNPTLTLAAATNLTTTLGIAGAGTVNLNGSIMTTDAFAVNSQGLRAATGYTTSSPTMLAIINSGAISTAITVPNSGINAAIRLGSDSLVNSGSISLTDTTGNTNPYLIEAAVIGGQSITNSGTITGAGAGAVATGGYFYPPQTAPTVTNSGTLTSNATTVLIEYAATIDNTGTIASTGQTAIGEQGSYYYSPIQINNRAGGIITGNGDAIELQGGTVLNAGTINGNVNLNYSGYFYTAGTYYDNGGTLNGNLTLNANGALVIDLANQGGGALGGVTGSINANGASLIYTVNSSASTAGAPAGAGFGTTGYLLANNSTLTFDSSSQQNATVALAGTGSVILNGAIGTTDAAGLTTQPQALLAATDNLSATNALSVINNGTIAVAADANWYAPVAVSLAASDTLINNGTITLNDSVTPSGYYTPAAVNGGLSVTNAGTISGTNTSAVAVGASLTNSGTITSNVQAITLAGFTTITNSGTITSTGGAAIGLSNLNFYIAPTIIVNQTGGVITGAPDAVDINGGFIDNAGTINGNVNLSSPYGYYSTGGYYDHGGTLNGNLTLATGQALVVDYGSNAGPLGGVTGTINANGAALLYNVSSDTTATPPLAPSGFGAVGYQLSNNAALTIPTGTTLTNTLALGGTGSVMLDGTITTSDQFAVQSVSPFALNNANAGNSLAITNNGTIATSNDNPQGFGEIAVALGTTDTLVNNGTISLTDTAGNGDPYYAAASGGLSVTNNGTITAAGATAVLQGYSYNSAMSATLSNSGTITSDQYAVVVNGPVIITNSGTIASSGTTAIIAPGFYTNTPTRAAIANLAGGTITGVGDAIDLYGGIVSNAGTINGNVNLTYSPFGYYGYASGAYVNAGGTLNGNLTLGIAQALITPLGSYDGTGFSGINGTVNANNAALIYSVSNDATVAQSAPAGFVNVGYQLSNNAALTLTADSLSTSSLYLSGIGSVGLASAITTVDQPAIYSAPIPTVSGAVPTNVLTITSNGALATTLDAYALDYSGFGSYGTVVLGAADSFTNNGSITLTNSSGSTSVVAAAINGGQTLINAGTIVASGATAVSLGNATSSSALALTNSGSIGSDLTAVQLNGPATVNNSGTIASGTGIAILNLGPGATQLTNAATGVISGATDAIDIAGGLVNNAGAITGNVDLGYAATDAAANATPAAYIANGGVLTGNLTFSSTMGGNELVETGSGYGVSGTITSGPGTNYVGHLRTSNATVTLGAPLPLGFGLEFVLASGASTQVDIQGQLTDGGNIFIGGTGSIINRVNTAGVVQNLPLDAIYGAPSDGVQLASFTNDGNLGGIDLMTNTLTNDGVVGSLSVTGAALTQVVNGSLSLTNNGVIQALATNPLQPAAPSTDNGIVQVVAANPLQPNAPYHNAAAEVFGTFAGIGQITNNGTITNGLSADILPAPGAAVTLNITNSGAITGFPYRNLIGIVAPRAIVAGITDLSASPDTTIALTNSGSITGNILLEANNLSVIDSGSITGNIFINRGTGNVMISGAFDGDIGGTGTTSLALTGGSAAAPVIFGTLSRITSYSQSAGYAIITGIANLGGATISGGTLVGLAGSTITSQLITVGASGTFASGGTINGNLAVNGTLHVGASPDTMTVNGNVTLASGSTSVFEVSPTASSKLVASGTVAIASNATLRIVQLQTLMPGTSIDLIHAAGGISGDFATLTGINGAIVERGDDLSLIGLFDATRAANPQVARGVNYLNTLIQNGAASPALLAALPALQTTSGAPASGAFTRLTPQAYASATQIGVENGLMLSRSMRELGWDGGLHSRNVFTFGQALGNWRGIDGSAGAGTSHADLSGYGFIGGIGLGSDRASIAAFGGYLDQTEDVAALGASTHAKGFVGGVTGRLASGPARLDVSLIYDDAHATTRRPSADMIALSGSYKLHGWTLDGEASTSLAVGSAWTARPHVGATFVWTRRGGTVEDNASVFALTVAGDHHDAGFVDGGIRFAALQDAIGRLSPYLDVGLRYQFQGRGAQALAGFGGGPVALFSDGVRRRSTSAVLAGGATYRATDAVSLFVTGSGDVSHGNNSGAVTGGVKVVF